MPHPGTAFYNALALARQQTEKLKQEKLAQINAASAAIANKREHALDRQQQAELASQQRALEQQRMQLEGQRQDKGFANALEIAKVNAGARGSTAEQAANAKRDVAKTTGDYSLQKEDKRQSGSNSRNDSRIMSNESIAGADRGSREGIAKANNASREGIASQHEDAATSRNDDNNVTRRRVEDTKAAIAEKHDQMVNDYNQGVLEWKKSNGQAKLDLEARLGDMRNKISSIKEIHKQLSDPLMKDEDRQSLMDQLKGTEVMPETEQHDDSLRSGIPKQLPNFQKPKTSGAKPVKNGLSPAQDVTDTGTAADYDEPLAQDVMKSRAKPSNPTTPQPTPDDTVAPSKGGVPKSGGVQQSNLEAVDNIERELIKADKAAKVPPAEIARKVEAGEYTSAARTQYNEAGTKEAFRKHPEVDGPLNSDQTENMLGDAVPKTWGNLPGRIAMDVGGMFKERGAQALDTVTGNAMQIPRSLGQSIISRLPGIDERTRANALSQLADLRGTETSQLTSDVKNDMSKGGSQHWVPSSAVGNGIKGGVELATAGLGNSISKSGLGGTLSKIPIVGKALGKAGGVVDDLASTYGRPLLDKALEVGNRPLSDLGGNAAKKALADAAASEASAAAPWGKKMEYSGKADPGASDFAKALRGDIDDASHAQVLENEVGDPAKLGLNQPASQPPQPNSMQMNAPRAVPAEVDPSTGIKTIPLEAPAGPKTLPIDVPAEVPPYFQPSGQSPASGAIMQPRVGGPSMTGPMTDDVANAAKMYGNPKDYPDPIDYDAIKTPNPGSFGDALNGKTPTQPEGPVDWGNAFGDMKQGLDRLKTGPQKPLSLDMRRWSDTDLSPKPSPSGENIGKVFDEMDAGQEAMEKYRAMKDTYVPNESPLPGGTKAFDELDSANTFKPNSMVPGPADGSFGQAITQGGKVSPDVMEKVLSQGVTTQDFFDAMDKGAFEGLDLHDPNSVDTAISLLKYGNK